MADFSDDDIERYIATGEPLEVAGCFTLEGIGSAFIESIQGDPSGVMGLSVPTVRALVEELGISWTNLWNATDAQIFTHAERGDPRYSGQQYYATWRRVD